RPGNVSLDGLGAGFDGSVLLFTTGLAVLTGTVFGLVPGLRSWRRGLADSGAGLRDELSPGRGEAGTRRVLVAVQVALCFVLVSGSGLFLRSLARGLGTDLGFRAPGVALARFDLSALEYGDDETLGFMEEVRRRVEGLPGVTAAGWGTRVPLQEGGVTATLIQEIPGYRPARDEEIRVEYVLGRGALLEALGVELLMGRDELETPGDAPAMLVDAGMAERYWGSPARALDGRFRVGEQWFRVAGVTGPVHWHGVDEEPRNYVLLPATGGGRPDLPVTLAVRTADEASSLLPILRRELQDMEPDLTFYSLGTAQDLVDRTLAPQRMGSLLFTAFALLAVVLAALGIGSIVAFAVARGRREIALRIALGATTRRVVGTAVLDMAAPVVVGLSAGTGAALLVGGTLEAFLVGLGARDPAVYSMAVALLAGTAALAALVPARGAARVDPVTALKET
ncbi:MAG TPA: FtsX-like permease family protein, partial [Longimicrobiales bacterium]|nr:FtsX-like permease family protein [Longimicrobiales bacterium]